MKKVTTLFVTLLAILLTVSPVYAEKKVDSKKDTKKEEVTEKVEENENLVKVYVFEAGGCPYCELELKYLKGLDSYKEKFTVIQKELYVDHVDWAQGKDYELGKTVAEAFIDAGFKDASYQGTPFVVISDIYAAASYNTSLETYIDQAFEEGDKDFVGCIERGEEDCKITGATTTEKKNNDAIIVASIFVVLVGGMAALIVLAKK